MDHSEEYIKHEAGLGPKFFYPKIDGNYIAISWYEAKRISSAVVSASPIQFIDYEEDDTKSYGERLIYRKIKNGLSELKRNDEEKYYDKYGNLSESRASSSRLKNKIWTKALITKWIKNWEKSFLPRRGSKFKVDLGIDRRYFKIKIYNPSKGYFGSLRQSMFGQGVLEIEVTKGSSKIMEGEKIRNGSGEIISLEGRKITIVDGDNKMVIDTYEGKSEQIGELEGEDISLEEMIG